MPSLCLSAIETINNHKNGKKMSASGLNIIKNKKGIIISSVMIAVILLVAGFLIIEMALFLNNFK